MDKIVLAILDVVKTGGLYGLIAFCVWLLVNVGKIGLVGYIIVKVIRIIAETVQNVSKSKSKVIIAETLKEFSDVIKKGE